MKVYLVNYTLLNSKGIEVSSKVFKKRKSAVDSQSKWKRRQVSGTMITVHTSMKEIPFYG